MSNEMMLTYQEIPQHKLQSKMFTNWNANDVVLLVLATLGVVASWYWLGAMMTLTVMLALLFPLVRFPKSYGRIYVEAGLGMKSWYVNHVLKGVWWEAGEKSRWKRFLRKAVTLMPLNLTRISAMVGDQLERYGMVQQTDRPYDHVFIAARGGAFSALDLTQQSSAVKQLADIVNRAILQCELKVGVTYLRITGPYDPSGTLVYLRTKMNPIVAHPQLFVIEDEGERKFAERLLRNSASLRPTMSLQGGASNWFLIVLTIKRPWAMRVVQWRERWLRMKPKLSSQKLYDQPILELGRNMTDSLASSSLLGLKDVHPLSMPEIAQVFRASLDISNQSMEEYYSALASGLIPRNDEELDRWIEANPGKDPAIALRIWPKKIIATNSKLNYIRVDDTWISVLRLTELPQRMRTDQALALHSRIPAGLWTRQAMVGESIAGRTETQQLVYGASALTNLQSAVMSGRVVEDPYLAKKKRDLAKQTNMFSSHTLAQYFNGLFPVMATSEAELVRHRKIVKAALADVGLRSEPVPGAFLQREALISGALGINRL